MKSDQAIFSVFSITKKYTIYAAQARGRRPVCHIAGRTDGIEHRRTLLLDSTTLTPLLKRMEPAGLVHRVRAANDERQVIISLTEHGSEMRKEAAKFPAQMMCASGCGLLDIAALKKQLDQLRASLADNA